MRKKTSYFFSAKKKTRDVGILAQVRKTVLALSQIGIETGLVSSKQNGRILRRCPAQAQGLKSGRPLGGIGDAAAVGTSGDACGARWRRGRDALRFRLNMRPLRYTLCCVDSDCCCFYHSVCSHCGSALWRQSWRSCSWTLFASSCIVPSRWLSFNIYICVLSASTRFVSFSCCAACSRARCCCCHCACCALRVIASFRLHCCLSSIRDISISCSFAAFVAALLCLRDSTSLLALQRFCRSAISWVVDASSITGGITVCLRASSVILSLAASARVCTPTSAVVLSFLITALSTFFVFFWCKGVVDSSFFDTVALPKWLPVKFIKHTKYQQRTGWCKFASSAFPELF